MSLGGQQIMMMRTLGNPPVLFVFLVYQVYTTLPQDLIDLNLFTIL